MYEDNSINTTCSCGCTKHAFTVLQSEENENGVTNHYVNVSMRCCNCNNVIQLCKLFTYSQSVEDKIKLIKIKDTMDKHI